MSSKKRKFQSLNESLPLFPTNFKHFKYSNEPDIFPTFVQVEICNLREVQNNKFEKQQLQIKQMLQKINTLDTHIKNQGIKICKLETILKNIEEKQNNDDEMLDLVNDVKSKLNLPESNYKESKTTEESKYKESKYKESKTSEEFSYIA